MISFGIDPGLGTMGWGVVRDKGGGLEAVAYGAITTEAHAPIPVRLADLYRQLTAKIAEHAPDVIAVERFFFGKSTTTAEMVFHARGAILLAAANAGRVPYEPTPNEVKMAVCGYGGADKRQVQGMVCALLGLERIPRPDDAADALAIAAAGISLAMYDENRRRGTA